MTILRRYWDIKITKTAKKAAGRDNVSYAQFKAAVEAFEALQYEESPVLRYDVVPVACTRGKLFRQRANRPLYLLHLRNIFAVVRQEREDGKRGTLVLLAVLHRSPDTYDPDVLQRLIEYVIAEAQQERAVTA